MTNWVERAGLKIGRELADLVEHEIAPGTGVDPLRLWEGYAQMLAELAPRLRQLLDRCQHGMGAVSDRGNPSCHALSRY